MARGVPKARTIKCNVRGCDARIRIYDNKGNLLPFKERIAKLRRHRKRKHPRLFKKSIKKAQKTKKEKKGNPCR